jgi:hypothetical protein
MISPPHFAPQWPAALYFAGFLEVIPRVGRTVAAFNIVYNTTSGVTDARCPALYDAEPGRE